MSLEPWRRPYLIVAIAHRARRFDPDHDRRRNRGIELVDGPTLVHQRLLDDHTGVAIQHRNRLLARM